MHEFSVMMLYHLALLALCLCSVDGHARLGYSEVEKFGNSCPRLDSCAYRRSVRSRELISIKENNCACDYLCLDYGDCCIDAPSNELRSTLTTFKCLELRQFGGVYMKVSCPPSYKGPEDVKHLCEQTDIGDRTDPLGSMPVTESLTGITYKNYYCSMCNNKFDNIVLWTPRLECPVLTLLNTSRNLTNEYVFQNLATDGHKWGLYLKSENGSLYFHDCDVDPVMPSLLENKIRLCKPDLISDCSTNWEDDEIRAMCRSYMGTKFVRGGRGYKNAHCALCNYENATRLSCQSGELRSILLRTFLPHSFALLLDINEKSGQEVGMVQMCESGEIFDPFFKKCRSLTCLPGYVRKGRQCLPQNSLSSSHVSETTENLEISYVESNSSNSNEKKNGSHEQLLVAPDIKNFSGQTYNVSEKTVGRFQNCLLISLVDEDYIMLPNQSIFVPKYNKIYEPTSYHAADGSILVCSHFEMKQLKFLPVMGYVTVFGLGISMFFLLLHFVAFCIVPDLQNLSGKNLVSQCTALFCAYCCFIAAQFDSWNRTSCAAIAFLTFYFFQVSFFWMVTMAYDVWRTLKMATTELRVSTGKQMKRFVIYSFFAWITPLFILIILAFAEYTDLFPMVYRPSFSTHPCWFKSRRALMVFFATPLFGIMLANFILFISSSRMIVMTTQTSSIKQQSKTQRRNFKLYLRLALLMGLTWVIGFIAGSSDMPILWYLFVVLNTLQGLFIFIGFTCSSKVVTYLKNKFKISSRPKDFKSSSQTASSGSAYNTKPTNLVTNS